MGVCEGIRYKWNDLRQDQDAVIVFLFVSLSLLLVSLCDNGVIEYTHCPCSAPRPQANPLTLPP